MWTCTECKRELPYDSMEVEQDRNAARGVCVTCYSAAQEADTVAALGLRKLAEAQHRPQVEPYRITCVGCTDVVGPGAIALDFGYRRDGTRWEKGYCTACLDGVQLAWLDKRAAKWVEETTG